MVSLVRLQQRVRGGLERIKERLGNYGLVTPGKRERAYVTAGGQANRRGRKRRAHRKTQRSIARDARTLLALSSVSRRHRVYSLSHCHGTRGCSEDISDVSCVRQTRYVKLTTRLHFSSQIPIAHVVNWSDPRDSIEFSMLIWHCNTCHILRSSMNPQEIPPRFVLSLLGTHRINP